MAATRGKTPQWVIVLHRQVYRVVSYYIKIKNEPVNAYQDYSVDSIKRTVLLNVLSLLSVLFSTVISKNLY